MEFDPQIMYLEGFVCRKQGNELRSTYTGIWETSSDREMFPSRPAAAVLQNIRLTHALLESFFSPSPIYQHCLSDIYSDVRHHRFPGFPAKGLTGLGCARMANGYKTESPQKR
jgi:hypothetical protein